MTDKIQIDRDLLESLLSCANSCDFEYPGEGYGQIAQRTFELIQDDLHREVAQPRLLDTNSLSYQIGAIGNRIHNIGCEHQNNERLSAQLEEIASELWEAERLIHPADRKVCVYDLSPASDVESAMHNKLVEMGWKPPTSPADEELRRDAERYRWLRSCSGDAHWSCYEKDGYGGLMLKSEESLDKAIDAAMQEKTV